MPTNLDLWRPYYRRGDWVWIEASNGRFIPGVVTHQVCSEKYRTKKGTIAARMFATPRYYVFTTQAGEIQKSAARWRRDSVKVTGNQLYPRHRGEVSIWDRLKLADGLPG